VVVDIPDVVTYTNFDDHRLRGFWVAGVKFPPLLLTFIACECLIPGGIRRSSRERLCCAMCIFYYARQAEDDVSNTTTDVTQPATEAGLCNVPTSHRAAVNVCKS